MLKLFKSKAFQRTSLITGSFALSFLLTFCIAKGANKQSKNPTKPQDIIQVEDVETAGSKLLNSILTYEAMEIDANVDILMEDNTRLQFNLDGEAQIKDIENIKLLAQLDANLAGTHIGGQLGYFGDTLSFALDNVCYFKLETSDLMDFIGMVPTYGVAIEVPESLSSLSFDTLTDTITSIAEEDKKTTPSGDYYYSLPFGEGEEAIEVMVLTDNNDNFKGIRVETFYYKGTKFAINANINEIQSLTISNPLENDYENKYQNFAPVFQLFDSFYNLTKEKQLGIKLDLDLEKRDEETLIYNQMLDASLLLNMDLDNKAYGINATINENNRTHVANFAYLEDTIYAKYHNVAVSLQTVTISNLIEYAMQEISAETINGLFEKISDSASSLDIGALSNKIKNVLKTIDVSSNNINIALDLTEFGLDDCSLINLGIDFSEDKIERIYVDRSEIKGFAFSIDITFVDYIAPNIIKDEYTNVEPLLVAVQSVLDLLDENKFRLEIDALMDNKASDKGDVTISGGVQFAIDPDRKVEGHKNTGFGYGELNIVDPDGYQHNIKADMKSVEEILFSYNNTLDGKFNIQTLKDLFTYVMDLVEKKDDHFMELFGELLEKLNSSPIAMAIAGDYGLLLNYDIISNLQISEEKLSCDISFEIFGMPEVKPHIELAYNKVEVDDQVICTLDSFSINKLVIGDQEISASIRLREFNESLESTRLDPSKSYLDFSDIKVLLELGVNTSRFNYYHFSVNAQLTLTALSLDLKNIQIPIDVKIRNDHGKVKVAAELDMPIVKLLLVPVNGAPSGYTDSSNRHVSFYYTSEDNGFYLHRTETTHKRSGLFSTKKGTYDLSEKLTGSYLKDNILDILLGDALGFGDTVLSLINMSTSSSSDSHQIKYENILEDFRYNKNDNYFDFAINVNELANTTVFSSTTLRIYADKSTNELTGVHAATNISVGLQIDIVLDLTLVDANETLTTDNQLTALDNYVAAHINDTVNTKNVNFY